MNREEIAKIIGEILDLHVKQSYLDRVKKPFPVQLPDSVFQTPALAVLHALPPAEIENLVTEITQLTPPETVAVEDVENFKNFLIATLLARALLFSKSVLKEWAWILQHLERLQGYWNVQAVRFEDQKENLIFYKFVKTLPVHHALHFRFIEELPKDFYLKYMQYRELVENNNYDKENIRQLAQENIYLCQGPALSRGSEYLADFIDRIYCYDVRVVFALGNVGVRDKVFYFPYMLFEPNRRFAVDFFNYFGKEHSDMIATNMRYQAYDLPAIRLNSQKSDTYDADIYRVNTKPLDMYNFTKAADAVNGCNLSSHELKIECLPEKPLTTIVHNFDVNDNNPGNFTDDQLRLIINSLVKAKVEGFGVAIHCMGGYGRTGMLAFIAARMFCPEMPEELDEALKWLRKFREGLIITVQQLLYAEEASQKIFPMLAAYKTANGYDWQRYYNDNHLDKHLSQITKKIEVAEEEKKSEVAKEKITRTALEALTELAGPLNNKRSRVEEEQMNDQVPASVTSLPTVTI